MSIKRSIVNIPVDQLTTDPTIQRPLDEARVNKIASEFNPNALGALTVSRRSNGEYVILDGQHRRAGAITAGYRGKVTCVQYEGLTRADEAALFLALNNTKQVGAIDKFRARVIAGDKDATAMQAILDQFGWKVAQSSDAWRLSAVTAFEKVYNGAGVRATGGDVLATNTLSVITQAWNGQGNSAHAIILGSLGKFLGWYGTDVDYDKLIGALAQIKPLNFVADVKAVKDVEHCDMANAGAKVLVNLHNKNRRKNLLEGWSRK